MLLKIDEAILRKCPSATVGYLTAEVTITKTDPFVEKLKKSLSDHLAHLGINATNFTIHPNIAVWRSMYEEDFKVKAKTYRSSVESLLRRVVTGKELWNICNIVDLYNCCSLLSLMPMGGYDLNKITGNVSIRFAKESETFIGIGNGHPISTASHQVVYADDQRVMCWLWNHKDAQATCIDEHTQKVLFFIDGFDRANVESALKLLSDYLTRIGGKPQQSGILDATSPQATL